MTRAVRWTDAALADFGDQIDYIAARNSKAARRVADAIDETASALGDMPTGRPGRVTETYEKLVIGLPYILAYVILEDTVMILRVIHTSRDWPAEAWPENA